MRKPGADGPGFAFVCCMLYVALEPTEQPGDVRTLAAKGTRGALSG